MGAGVGAFLAQDQPRPFRPGVQVDNVGGLGHPAPSRTPPADSGPVSTRWSLEVGGHGGLRPAPSLGPGLSVMGKPNENPTPRRQARAANLWVAPAESERAST